MTSPTSGSDPIPFKNPPTAPVEPIAEEYPSALHDQQVPFSLPQESSSSSQQSPSPIAVASVRPEQVPSAQDLLQQVQGLQGRFDTIHNQLNDGKTAALLSSDHWNAMNRVMMSMNPDLATIAKETGSTFHPPVVTRQGSSSLLQTVLNWVNGSQEVMRGALNYLSTPQGDNPNPASYLKLQYSMQRATQRGELFSSIIGSSVSGIKTIMSTQLG